jgi:hypothetical protein
LTSALSERGTDFGWAPEKWPLRAHSDGGRTSPQICYNVIGRSRSTSEDIAMGNMTTIEIKSFVPSKDFDLSKRFYIDLGFTVSWSSDDLAYLHAGNSSFLLQRFYRTMPTIS